MSQETDHAIHELGKWLGRSQAFRLIQHKCSAAQAHCLRNLRERGDYKPFGTWEDYCERHIGISRATADRIIQQLDEFGEAYFHLSQIMQISPETFRQIAGAVSPEAIELEGEKVPITPDNARRIRDAVSLLRRQFDTARSELHKMQQEALSPALDALRDRLSTCLADLATFSQRTLQPEHQGTLLAIMEDSSARLHKMAEAFRLAWRLEPKRAA